MNNPAPLPPLGPLAKPAKAKFNVRIAVITVLALHAVFFGGLLLQGCKRQPGETSGLGGGLGLTNTNTDLGALTNAAYPDLSNSPPATTASNVASAPPPAFPATNPLPPAPATAGLGAPAPAPAAAGPGEYTVVAGDYPAKIAKEHGISVSALMKANPGLNARHLKVNQKLVLPGGTAPGAGAGAEPAAAPAGAEPSAAAETGAVHVVNPGENLTKIAHHYGVSLRAIRTANDLKTDRINAGQKLKIPARKTAVAAATPASTPLPSAPAPQPTPDLH